MTTRRGALARAGGLALAPLTAGVSAAQSAAPRLGELRHTFDNGTYWLWRWGGSSWQAAPPSREAVAYATKSPGWPLDKVAVYVGDSWAWLGSVLDLAT